VELVSPRIVVFGEGMIEERADGSLAWGGDVVNTAVYLARQGAAAELLTAMGVDGDCERLVAAWADEGVGVGHVLRDSARTCGRYRITLGPGGERSFTYDRDRSAARGFFERPEAEAALAWAAEADILYLSGITLSIFGDAGRARSCELAAAVRARGGAVAFDPNYRPAGWPSAEAAWRAIVALAPHLSLALPSAEDHARLRGEADPERMAADWRALGIAEVAVKLGAAGAYGCNANEAITVPAAPTRTVLDATGAGDAFNAAFIAARLIRREPLAEALGVGCELAAAKLAWPGAITPRPVGVREI
jgi:2-dehydro-3-deoxygluconokinase